MITDGNDMVMPVAPAGNSDNAPNESVRQKLMGIMNEV